QPFSRITSFPKRRFGGAQSFGEVLPRRLLILQRSLEAFDWADCPSAEKCHWYCLANHAPTEPSYWLNLHPRRCGSSEPANVRLGQKQTFAVQRGMFALPPIADMCSALADVCLVPIADIVAIHSIISSARCWSCKDTSRPSAFAAFRLIAN